MSERNINNENFIDSNDPLGLFTDNPSEEQKFEQNNFRDEIGQETTNAEPEIKYTSNAGINFNDVVSEKEKRFRENPNFTEIPIIGKNISSNSRREVNNMHFELQKEYKELKFEGEQEKTEEDLLYISKVNTILTAELKKLGINKKVQFSPNQLHFLDEDNFKAKYSTGEDLNVFASAQQGVQTASFDKDRTIRELGKASWFNTIMHESIHLASHAKYYHDSENNKGSMYRLGYSNVDRDDTNIRLFRGLNEAVVEKTSQEFTKRYKQQLINELNIEPEEFNKDMAGYKTEIEILDVIMSRIALVKDESYEDVWGRFKKGEFSGEMMHMRDIEEVFGKGSLRMLSILGASHTKYHSDTNAKSIMKYFKSHNISEKLAIVLTLIDENQSEKYHEKIPELIDNHGEVEAKALEAELLKLKSELEISEKSQP